MDENTIKGLIIMFVFIILLLGLVYAIIENNLSLLFVLALIITTIGLSLEEIEEEENKDSDCKNG